VGKEIHIERAICCLAHRRNLLPQQIRRLRHATDRAQTSRVANSGHQRGRRKGIPPVWAALPVPAEITDSSMLD
jgi:hypothetical protein